MANNLKLNYDIARNDLARAFLFRDGIYKADAVGEYLNNLGVDGLSQDRGDITKIEAPSPIRYGEFVEVMALPGEVSRMTTSLTGRMSRNEISTFYKLFEDSCSFDLHLHFGQCQRPDSFNEYDKALIFEDVYVTSFSTDPLAALTSGDRAVISESVDISIGSFYEVVSLLYNVRGAAVVTDGGIVAVKMCDIKSCGGACNDRSGGCNKGFAVSSDGTFYYTNDAGVTWTALPIEDATPVTPLTPATVVDMVCYQDLVIILDTDGDFWYANRDELLDGTATTFSTIASGLSGAGTALDTFLNKGFVVGAAGSIVSFVGQDVGTVAVTSNTTENLNDVHVSSDGTAVAVGANGTVVYSNDGINWLVTVSEPANVNLTAVVAKSAKNWLVGATDGTLWATDNNGVTWSQVAFPGWLAPGGAVKDLALSTAHVVWMAQGNSLFRSIDGGNTWSEEPNTRASSINLTNANTVGTCLFDPNFVLVGGDLTAVGKIIGGTPQ